MLCSSDILGPNGVTPAHGTRVIGDIQIRIACANHLEECKADVYMNNHCGGDVIATAIFSVTRGILSITPPKYGYSVTHTPFQITINGGPAKN